MLLSRENRKFEDKIKELKRDLEKSQVSLKKAQEELVEIRLENKKYLEALRVISFSNVFKTFLNGIRQNTISGWWREICESKERAVKNIARERFAEHTDTSQNWWSFFVATGEYSIED